MTMIGEQCSVRLEFRAGVLDGMTPAGRAAAEAWLADCESVLQREADRTEVRQLPDGSVAALIRKPDGQ